MRRAVQVHLKVKKCYPFLTLHLLQPVKQVISPFPFNRNDTIEINLPWHLDQEVHKGINQCQLVWVSFKHL